MNTKRWTAFLILAILVTWQFVLAPADAQKDGEPERITFDLKAAPADPFSKDNAQSVKTPFKARRGELVKVVITGSLAEGYYTYPATIRTARQKPIGLARIELVKTNGLTPLWPITETEPQTKIDADNNTIFTHSKPFTWSQDVFIPKEASPGPHSIPFKYRLQVCNKGACEWIEKEAKVNFIISDEPAAEPTDEVLKRIPAQKPPIDVVTIGNETAIPEDKEKGKSAPGGKSASSILEDGLIRHSAEEYKKKIEEIGKQIEVKNVDREADLGSFILAGIFWGFISLITPCVFPMIPITVSYFLKQSEKEHHRPIVLATVYSATIVIVLTLAATLLFEVLRWLSVHYIANYVIGALFIFFALSLFGMYEIELPSFLAQYTSSREGQGGYVGTVFMALTFTIISFACVAPFLGGFGGTATAERPWWHSLLGGLAFAVTFASPFFVLALFPALLRKLPKSGSWLNVVKVVMGFLELAAALKFFRKAELIQTLADPSFFTFDMVLGIWIALCVACGLYLLCVFRLPHDTPEDHVSVPRLMFAVAFFGLAVYLTPALFRVNAAGETQRPGGAVYAWIDAFLLPETGGGEAEMPHTGNLDYAVRLARDEYQKTGKPKRIFIDFTGIVCDNCNKNEKSVFTKPNIGKLFEPYIVVKMYCDGVPAKYYSPEIRAELQKDDSRATIDAEKVNAAFQGKFFGTKQLPLYVIIEPQRDATIRVIDVYPEGLINNVPAFAEFLKGPKGP
jgi:thiol:disulfide interchange protein DsbD